MNQYFDDDFYMFEFFINDEFIRSTITELIGSLPINAKAKFRASPS